MTPLLRALCVMMIATSALAAPFDLRAPADGTHLLGGSTATIAWTATALPEHVEEWEAFLSVDGGRYYALRITPHLDADIRSFRWRVPNVVAHDARLLIRIGNEREEIGIELPQRFSIDFDPLAATPLPEPSSPRREAEAARPGDAPVAAWVAGHRDGSALARHHRAANERIDGHDALLLESFVTAEESSELDAYALALDAHPARLFVAHRPFRAPPPRTVTDLLLQTSRLNI